jgi:hypothetical protein
MFWICNCTCLVEEATQVFMLQRKGIGMSLTSNKNCVFLSTSALAVQAENEVCFQYFCVCTKWKAWSLGS